jgi:hypothetical protein
MVGSVLGVVLLAACGSTSATGENTAAPAGAKENAASVLLPGDFNGEPICFDWPDGTVAKPCAMHLRGPGGGRVFYVSQGRQSWGRFLEVAPQRWNVTLHECPGSGWVGSSCDTADAGKYPKSTSDVYGKSDGWLACSRSSTYGQATSATPPELAEPAGSLPAAIGSGRANTAAVLAVAECTAANPDNSERNWSAFQKAANYRGGGFADWFIPSKDELDLLCHYDYRNGIGGFPQKWHYLSSTTTSSAGSTYWARIRFDRDCSADEAGYGQAQTEDLVRPIRAF